MSKLKKHLDNYNKFLTKGQLPKAIDALEQVVNLSPKDVNHRKKLADMYFRANRKAEAFTTYEGVARSFAEGGFYLKAIAVYRQMQKIDPTQAMVYEQLADLNQKQGLTGQALSEYNELVAILEKNERFTEAAEILAKMAKLDPSNIAVRIRAAESYCRAGNKDQGLSELNEVSKELRKKGDMATLRKLYELFMRQFPEDLSIQAGMARSLISSGDPARALQLLQGLLKREPDNIDILGNLANAYRATKDHENERLTFKQLIKQNPDFLDFHKGYARACLDAGSPEKALDHLEQCKQLFEGPEQQKALVSYYEKLHEILAGEERIVATLRELYSTLGLEAKLEDFESQLALLEEKGFDGFDQDVEELEPLEEVEELETLEEVEELEPLEEVEELDEFEPADEVETLEPLDDAAEGGDFELVEEDDESSYDLSDYGEAEELLTSGDEEFAGFDTQDETTGFDMESSIDAGEDFTGMATPDEEPEVLEEIEDLDVPVEESVLDLELEIEFDADSVTEDDVVSVPEVADDAEGLDSGDDLDLDLSADLEGDAGPESELDLDVAGSDDELDLDVDMGELSVDFDEEDLSAEPDPDELSLEDAEPDYEIADGLEIPEGGYDGAAEDEEPEADEDIGLETNGFDISDIPVDEETESSIVDDETDFLESGLETLADIQGTLQVDEDLDDATPAAYAPQRDLLTELEEAEFYIHQGLFDEAVGVCNALKADFPDAPEIASKLAEIEAQREQAAAEEPLAVDDEGFFDLASELSNESVFEAGSEMGSLDERDLSRLDGILSEFKKGIEEQIDQEDTETHFNLGIAYKEMGLLDDAIAEFERVMVDPKRVVDCLTLSGICHAEKGDFAKAEETFKLGLGSAEASEEDRLTLNYELGIICEAAGRPEDAAGYFQSVVERDPNFRDVANQLAAVTAGNKDDSSNSGDNRISFV